MHMYICKERDLLKNIFRVRVSYFLPLLADVFIHIVAHSVLVYICL